MMKSYVPLASVSARMRAVRGRGTKCELALEAALRRRRLAVVAQVPVFGCTPDLVVRGVRLAIFVDGDFWHGRKALDEGSKAFRASFRGDSRQFWIEKIQRNIRRDARQANALRRRGWSVVRVWERDVLRDINGVAELVLARVGRRRAALKRRRGAS
ncbi:DUF559 domain-containing protein [Bradyrhizobium sp. USDA 4011]